MLGGIRRNVPNLGKGSEESGKSSLNLVRKLSFEEPFIARETVEPRYPGPDDAVAAVEMMIEER